MGTGTYVQSAQQRSYEVQYCGFPAVRPAKDRVCLVTNTAGLSAASTKAAWIQAENNVANGYVRAVLGRRITNVDTVGSVLTSAEHGLSAGDRGFISSSTVSGEPSGLSAGTPYFVINATTNTFQLSLTSGGSAVTISGTGSGTIIFRPSGVFDGVDNRFEAIWEPASFTASGGTLSYAAYFILRDAADIANVTISSVNISTEEFTTSSAHGVTTGDEVMITLDSGTFPTGITAGTIYFARAVSSTIISLHPTATDATNNTNKINITAAGSGTFRLRNAQGVLDGYEIFGSTQNLLDGRQVVTRIFRNVLNAGTLTGV